MSEARRSGTAQASIVAVGLEVLCPHCGESLVNPRDESFVWTSTEIESSSKSCEIKICNACDERFSLIPQNMAMVQR